MNELLRQKAKALKAFQNVRYKELAELLEIRADSFYNWLNGQYDFSAERLNRLYEIIGLISEV